MSHMRAAVWVVLPAFLAVGCGGSAGRNDGGGGDVRRSDGPTGGDGSTEDARSDGGGGQDGATDATDGDPGRDGTPLDGPGDAGADGLCPGLLLEESAVLDLDLQTITLGGHVTLNGAEIPDSPTGESRGTLIFREVNSGHQFNVGLGSSGPADYQTTLTRGEYEVRLAQQPGNCTGELPAGMPCNRAPIGPRVMLTDDGTLDLDIPSVSVSGAITFGGAQPPAGLIGQLVFIPVGADIPADGGEGQSHLVGAELSIAGTFSYSLTLLPGAYRVIFMANITGCDPSILCSDAVVIPEVDLAQDRTLDVDLVPVRLSGQISVNGQPLADAPGGRGTLRLVPTLDSGNLPNNARATFADLGATGSGYAVTVLRGTYHLDFIATSTCDGGSSLPCNSGRLKDAMPFVADAALDLDLPVVSVSGRATLNRAPFPQGSLSAARGSLLFTRAQDGAGLVRSVELATSGEATYQVRLLAGAYTVGYSPPNPPRMCFMAPIFPCPEGPVLHDVGLRADTLLDVDVAAIDVSGRITLAGATLPEADRPRGQLVFSLAGGGTTMSAPLGATGEGSYTMKLLAGRYTVSWSGNGSLCAADAPPSPGIPCNGGPLRQDLEVAADRALDFDLPAVTVSGALTLNGGPLPDQRLDRGVLGFQRIGAGSTRVTRMLGATGTAGYTLTLLPGRYVVAFDRNSVLACDTPENPIPCPLSLILQGCGP